jgi:hypothetical protein
VVIVRMGANDILKICFNLQEWNNNNYINWAALLKLKLDVRDWATFACKRREIG